MADLAAVLIDGGYLDKINNGNVRIDYGRLVQALSQPQQLWRAYYYNCPPYQSAIPSPDQKERYSKAMSFYSSLRKISRFTVRLGRLKFRGQDNHGKPIFEQKRVDLLLGLDIAEVASSERVSVVVLLAGDGDFLPAILAAKEKMTIVRLAHGPSSIDPVSGRLIPSYDKDLWDNADERVEINHCFLSQYSR